MPLPLSYTTVAQITQTVPAIGSATSILSADIAAEAGKIQAMIDGKLATRYSVPFSPVPPIIEAIATDCSAYALLTKRMWASNRTIDEKMVSGLKSAFDFLDALASGSMALVNSAGTLVSGRTDRAQIDGSHMDFLPTFDEHHVYDQIQDEDKIEAIYDERQL